MVNWNKIVPKLFQIKQFHCSCIPYCIKLYQQIMPFYAVARGKPIGIFETWPECQAAVNGVTHAKYKKFDTRKEAEEYINMFKGKYVVPTKMEVLTSPGLEDISPDMFAEELMPDESSNDGLDKILAEHLNNIESVIAAFKSTTADILEEFEQMSRSYKVSLTNEISDFKQKLLSTKNGEMFLKKNFSSSTNTPKNKRKLSKTDETGEHSRRKCARYPLPVDDDGFVHVYTDGACENNGKVNARAGLGVWFGEDHPLNVGEPVEGRATNNVGEIQACTRAIKIAHEAGVKKLCINTDSQFVINSMTAWINNWKKRDWKLKEGGPVKNKYDFIELDKACQLLEVKWKFVKGHAGIAGNDGADALARAGAQKYGQ